MTCLSLVNEHHCNQPFSLTDNTWLVRHASAWERPRNGAESGLKSLIVGYATLADLYDTDPTWDPEERRTLGGDGYFGEHAESMIQAMLAYLNFDCGRFDCGTLDRLIRELAALSGVELPE